MEPKLFFASERTFIKWMEMAVVMSTISSAILAFATPGGIYLIGHVMISKHTIVKVVTNCFPSRYFGICGSISAPFVLVLHHLWHPAAVLAKS